MEAYDCNFMKGKIRKELTRVSETRIIKVSYAQKRIKIYLSDKFYLGGAEQEIVIILRYNILNRSGLELAFIILSSMILKI